MPSFKSCCGNKGSTDCVFKVGDLTMILINFKIDARIDEERKWTGT